MISRRKAVILSISVAVFCGLACLFIYDQVRSRLAFTDSENVNHNNAVVGATRSVLLGPKDSSKDGPALALPHEARGPADSAKIARGRLSKSTERVAAQAEKSVLSEGRIDGQKAGALMLTDNFTDLTGRLHEVASDSDMARDLTQLYSEEVASELGAYKDLNLVDMACGTVVCTISLSSSDNSLFDIFKQNFEKNENAPVYAIMQSDVTDANGLAIRRIIVSTDPDAVGIVFR